MYNNRSALAFMYFHTSNSYSYVFISSFVIHYPLMLLFSPVHRGVAAGGFVLLDAAELDRPAGGAGGTDGGLHGLGLHQPRAAAEHPESVPADAPGHPAAGARLGWGGTFLYRRNERMRKFTSIFRLSFSLNDKSNLNSNRNDLFLNIRTTYHKRSLTITV